MPSVVGPDRRMRPLKRPAVVMAFGQRFGGVEHRLGPLQKQPALLGQVLAARGALDELDAIALLQPLDAAAHHGRRQVQLPRRARESCPAAPLPAGSADRRVRSFDTVPQLHLTTL